MKLSTRKEWLFNLALLLVIALAGLWTVFDQAALAQTPAAKAPQKETDYATPASTLPGPTPKRPKVVSPLTRPGKPPLAAKPPKHLPDPVLTPIRTPLVTPVKTPIVTPVKIPALDSIPIPVITLSPTTATALTTGTTLTTGTAIATAPTPTPWVATYLNIGRVNLFSALITPTPTPTPRAAKTPAPPNLTLALRDWELDYPMKRRTIWVFHNKRLRGTDYNVELNKPFSLTDGRNQFEATLVPDPDDKYGVKFVYPGPPATPTQQIGFSMVK